MEATSGKLGLLASQDFLFVTRICDTARALGLRVQTVGRASEVMEMLQVEQVGLLLIDLDQAASLLAEVPAIHEQAPGLQIVAYGSHVETALLKQARAAGCDQVLPRSKFTTELAGLLTAFLGNH